MHVIGKTYFAALLFSVGSQIACGPHRAPDAAADTIDNKAAADTIDNNSTDERAHAAAADAKEPRRDSERAASATRQRPGCASRALPGPRKSASSSCRDSATDGSARGQRSAPLLWRLTCAAIHSAAVPTLGSGGARAFVILCPRGVALPGGADPGYFFRNHLALEREVTAALPALKQELGARLSPGDAVYSGYSQGATMGALMVIAHGAEFPNLVLVEGGSGDWTLGRAKKFRETGGKSVAIVCGTPNCAKRGERSVAVLEKAGLRARGSTGARRTVYDGRVATRHRV